MKTVYVDASVFIDFKDLERQILVRAQRIQRRVHLLSVICQSAEQFNSRFTEMKWRSMAHGNRIDRALWEGLECVAEEDGE